tara:strand:- start:697 stop:1497 length:801 start_codon:yes stop_codon:yes gene_type:complete
MPHALLKDFKSQLSSLVASNLGQLKAMAVTYGNKKTQEIIEELKIECPSPEVLVEMTKIVDNLNNLMNKADKQVMVMKSLPKKLEKAVVVGKVITELLSHLPIPSSVPPGVGIPLGIIQGQANFLVFTRKMIENIQTDQKAINSIISSTSGAFEPIKAKLSTIEILLAQCASNPNLTQEERDAILKGAQGNTKDPNLPSLSYTAANGRSYMLTVVIEDNVNTVIPRRKAIAKDYREIVVLEGPFSFAGSEQVLLDELKFRLDNQLP